MNFFLNHNANAKENGTVLDLTYKLGKDRRVRFLTVEPLEHDDLRILQGIARLLKKYNSPIKDLPGGNLEERLDAFLETNDLKECFLKEICLTTTVQELLEELGSEKPAETDVWSNILRMGFLNVSAERGKTRVHLNLFNRSRIDKSTGEIFVAVNPYVVELFV